MRLKTFLQFGLVLTAAFAFSQNAETATAQALSNNQTSGNQLFCERDFSNYLANGIDLDGEGFLDYWGDIIDLPGVGWSRYSANYCHYSDIESLLNRIDKARKQLRQAFYVCDENTSARVSSQYKQLSMELYYVRHFIDTKPFIGGADASDAIKNESVVKRSEIQAEFMNRFAGKSHYFDRNTTLRLFEEFEAKYAGKIEGYRNCTDVNMDALRLQLTRLGTTFDQVNKLGDRLKTRIENRKKTSEVRIQESNGVLSAFSADSVGDVFRSLIDFRVNGENLSDKTVFENFLAGKSPLTAAINDAGDFGVNVSGSDGYTYQQVLADSLKAQKRDENINLDLAYLAEMELKYKESSGIGLDKAINRLEELKIIIEGSLAEIASLRDCTARIVAKQCSNK